MSSRSRFYLFFPNLAFMPFSCLIFLAGLCSTMLNRNGDSKHSCLLSSWKEEAFSVSPLSIIAVGFP